MISSTIINQRISEIETNLINIYTEFTSLNLPLTEQSIRDELKERLKEKKEQVAELIPQLNAIDYLQIFIEKKVKIKAGL